MLERAIKRAEPWDFVIIGGGASGVGVALEAASRGYSALLLEQSDFGAGTSSRSTKLVHGGVRYLKQGNVSLVREALRERGILRRNAPHVVHDLAFVVPGYLWWERPFYGVGLKCYDLLSGRYRFGRSRLLSAEETRRALPTIQTEGLRGGIEYHDGLFDDARLLINLVRTAANHGATLLNYVAVTGLELDAAKKVRGVIARDEESGTSWVPRASVVINTTGPSTDALRRMADPNARPMITTSQGAHIVVDKAFLPGDAALMVPSTPDGRVLFAIPWHGHTLIGTTETPIDEVPVHPYPLEREIDFLIETAGRYLERKPARSDILSAFAGIRPLVRSTSTQNTAALSRGHTIHCDASGLVTLTGGKWTTYRNMAEDCVDQAAELAGLPSRPSVTVNLRIHGYADTRHPGGRFAVYGSDAPLLEELIRVDSSLVEPLHPALPTCGAEIVWAARYEMACTIEDALGRRTRALFLNARAALAMATRAAQLMAAECGRDAQWQQDQVARFVATAARYLPEGAGKSV